VRYDLRTHSVSQINVGRATEILVVDDLIENVKCAASFEVNITPLTYIVVSPKKVNSPIIDVGCGTCAKLIEHLNMRVVRQAATATQTFAIVLSRN